MVFVSDVAEVDASIAALERSIALYRELEDLEAEARALVVLQNPVWIKDGRAAGWACTQMALALLEPVGPSEALAFALVRIGHNEMIDRRRERAREILDRARHIAEHIGSAEIAWRVDMLIGTVEVVMGDPERGVELLQASVRDAESIGERQFVSSALGMLGSGGGEARKYREALPALHQGVSVGLAVDDDMNVAYNLAWLARVAFEQCRWDDAVDHAEQALAYNDPDGVSAVTARSVIGRTRVRRGDPGALDPLAEITDRADDFLFQYVWNSYCGTAEHAWLRGDGASTAPLLHHAFQRAMASDSPWARGEVGFWMWRIGEIDRPPDGAAEPFAAQIRGDWRAAADLWRDIGCAYETAMALADGDEPALREAIEILDDLGATPAARFVRTRWRDAGTGPVPRGPIQATLANPAHLTRRQLEVLELVAQGLSNATIGERLFVSRKTVEHHVSAIFAKLGVDSRAAAVVEAKRLGVIEI